MRIETFFLQLLFVKFVFQQNTYMQFYPYQSYQLKGNNPNKAEDNLVIEAPLQININGTPYTVVMRTPNDDYELVRGLLYAEDIYKKKEDFILEIIKERNKVLEIINILIPNDDLGAGYLNKRTLLSVSSCGVCGKTELESIHVVGKKLKESISFSLSDLETMQLLMESNQHTFQKTGGSHAAAIFNLTHNLLVVKEDIGRHNALDKCVGALLQKDKLKDATFLFVSGRVSYEIISKAFIAKINVIVAVSAVSSLAVDFAKEFGICLIGFKRKNKLTVYSKPEYLKILENA